MTWCLWLSMWTASAADVVSMSRESYLDMVTHDERIEEQPAPVVVGARRVHLHARDDEVAFEVAWDVTVREPSWVSWRLAGSEVDVRRVEVGGTQVEVTVTEEGSHLHAWLARDTTIALVGGVAGDVSQEDLSWTLMPGARGRVEAKPVRGLTWQVEASGAIVPSGGAWWTSAEGLTVRAVRARREALGSWVRLMSSTGLTVGDAEVEGRARLGFQVHRQATDTLVLDLQGVGDDLELTGPRVRSVEALGSRWVLHLDRPVRGDVEVEARWSMPLASGAAPSVPVPVFSTSDGRTDAVLLITRDDPIAVVPQLSSGRAVSAASVAKRTDGLVLGEVVAAFEGVGGGQVTVQRFAPADMPPLVVDVADWSVALAREGRVLMQGTLTLRNERGAFLDVGLPPDHMVLAAQVDGAPVTVSPRPQGVRIWLPRSVETVEGPLAFPVDLTVLGTGDRAWLRRDVRRLVLPSLSVPTAVRRVTVSAPRSWVVQRHVGRGGMVETFNEGASLSYGFGKGVEEAQAQAVFRDALSSWLDNDVDDAQGYLDQLEEMGASNDNVVRLRSNLEATLGGVTGRADGSAARRIREQARARAVDEVEQQEAMLRQADFLVQQGQWDAAEALYGASLSLSEKLEELEEEESVVQAERRSSAMAGLQLAAAERIRKRKAKAADVAPEPAPVLRGVLDSKGVEPELYGASEVELTSGRETLSYDVEDVATIDSGLTALEFEGLEPMQSPLSAARRGDGPSVSSDSDVLAITATPATVVPPRQGDEVRFQHLLIPAGDASAIVLSSKRSTRSSR